MRAACGSPNYIQPCFCATHLLQLQQEEERGWTGGEGSPLGFGVTGARTPYVCNPQLIKFRCKYIYFNLVYTDRLFSFLAFCTTQAVAFLYFKFNNCEKLTNTAKRTGADGSGRKV